MAMAKCVTIRRIIVGKRSAQRAERQSAREQGIQGSRTKARFCDATGRTEFTSLRAMLVRKRGSRLNHDPRSNGYDPHLGRLATCDIALYVQSTAVSMPCLLACCSVRLSASVCSLSDGLTVCCLFSLLSPLLLSLFQALTPNRYARVTSATCAPPRGVTIRDNTHSSEIGGLGLTHGPFRVVGGCGEGCDGQSGFAIE